MTKMLTGNNGRILLPEGPLGIMGPWNTNLLWVVLTWNTLQFTKVAMEIWKGFREISPEPGMTGPRVE